jgi:hypothetical protein
MAPDILVVLHAARQAREVHDIQSGDGVEIVQKALDCHVKVSFEISTDDIFIFFARRELKAWNMSGFRHRNHIWDLLPILQRR